MRKPNIKIVDTLIQLKNYEFNSCINQLRDNVLPMIRIMQEEESLKWFCFLLHDQLQLSDRLLKNDENFYIHLKLCPSEGVSISDIENLLFPECEYTKVVELSRIAGIKKSILRNQDWLNAWWIIGEISELVLNIIEAHNPNKKIGSDQFMQFYHYATNMISLGGQFLMIPFPIRRI